MLHMLVSNDMAFHSILVVFARYRCLTRKCKNIDKLRLDNYNEEDITFTLTSPRSEH